MTDPDAQTPAEERLLVYLEGLREDPPRAGDELVATVVAAARWQALARPYLAAFGLFGPAFAVGVRMFLGMPPKR